MNIIAILGMGLNWLMLTILSLGNRGEVKAGDPPVVDPPTEKLLTQAQVDAIVQDRLARDRTKYADYDTLKQFKIDHERSLEVATQKELEAKKEYEKLKESWTKKEQEYAGVISKKDAEIVDMRIGSALMTEIVKQNAYAEETMALIKSQAIFDKDGNIYIKGKDVNNLDINYSITEGIKQFLIQRPHLVKIIQKAGGGTGGGNAGASGAGATGNDLTSLNNQLQEAMHANDSKRVGELRIQIKAVMASKGIRL